MPPLDLLAQFASPVGPDLSTDAGDFAVWAINIAGGVFVFPHFMSFIGAIIDRAQYHRFVMKDKLPADFRELTPYVETKWVFAEALFLVIASGLFIATLNHWDKI